MIRFRSYLVLLLLAGVFSCGGGGGGGASSPGPAPSVVGSFTADQPNPGNGDVALGPVAGGSAGDQVAVEVSVTGVNDVFTASFDVIYDANLVEFVNWARGSALETGGTVSYLVNAAQPGRLQVGVSCTGCPQGVNIGATAPLIELIFRMRQAGTSSVSFANEALLNSQAPAPAPIPGLSWFGGTFVAN